MTDPNSMLLVGEDFLAITNELLICTKKLESDFKSWEYTGLGMTEYFWQLRVDVTFSPINSMNINSIMDYPLDYHMNRAKILIDVFNKRYKSKFVRFSNRKAYKRQKAIVENIQLFISQLNLWIENQKSEKVRIFSVFVLKDKPMFEMRRMTGVQSSLLLDILTNSITISEFATRMRSFEFDSPAVKESLEYSLIDLETEELINS